jgi:hypothetical protein
MDEQAMDSKQKVQVDEWKPNPQQISADKSTF